jgi:hypothetical protein
MSWRTKLVDWYGMRVLVVVMTLCLISVVVVAMKTNQRWMDTLLDIIGLSIIVIMALWSIVVVKKKDARRGSK